MVVVKPLIWAVGGSRITLTISAVEQTSFRMALVQTIVNIDVVDVNESPKFVDSSVIIGYPGRTYFDPAVPMPIYTAKVSHAKMMSQHFECKFIHFLCISRPTMATANKMLLYVFI